jgi:hypothetical protein
MTAIPLARYLVDFGTASETVAQIGAADRKEQEARAHAEAIAARAAEAHERGLQEGRRAAEAEVAARMEAQAKALEQKLESERKAWVLKESHVIAERLVAGLRHIETRTAEVVARILEPFIAAEAHRAAVSELLAALEAVLSKSAGASVEISGPADLIAALRDRLARYPPSVKFDIRDVPDVRIELDHAVLETRVGAWMAHLEEAVR